MLSKPKLAQGLVFIEIELSMTNYIHFFGIVIRDPDTPIPDAAILLKISTLEHLILRFRSPFNAIVDDPSGWTWRRGTGPSVKNPVFTLPLTSCWPNGEYHELPHLGCPTSCQKVLVDWILTFAKKYIAHITKVTLCGFIKNSTR